MVLIKNLEQFEKAKISKEQSAMVALFCWKIPIFVWFSLKMVWIIPKNG